MDPDFKKKFETLLTDVKAIKEMVNQTDRKMENITKELKEVKNENKLLKRRIVEVENQNSELERVVGELEQYGMVNDLIVAGIPMTEEEDLIEVTKNLAGKLDVELKDYDIATAHRLPTKKGIPPFIVRMVDRQKKTLLINRAKEINLKGENFGTHKDNEHKVYLNEHLSQHTRSLLTEVRRIRDDGIVKFAWSKEGKVFVRVAEKEKVIRVRSLNEIEQLERELSGKNDDEPNGIEDDEQRRTAAERKISVSGVSTRSKNQKNRKWTQTELPFSGNASRVKNKA
jgi:hypothetical protein